MDRDVIDAKLESLRRCIERLREKLPANAADLARNVDLQDIIALNLIRAVQLSTDVAAHVIAAHGWPVPATMGEGFSLLSDNGAIPAETAARMRAAVGFRNIAVHSYERIDWAIVQSILERHLSDFDTFASAIAGLSAET